MVKSTICVTTCIFFLVINTIILFLKPEFTYAKNDEDNYCVYYQKWVRTAIFMSTIIMALFCIYFAINFYHLIAYCLLALECILVIIYALCKYKGITINGENIKVQRLFRKDVNLNIKNILQVNYIPNAKMVIKIRKKDSFDVSFNSENFHKLYKNLIKHGVKFKTGRIPSNQNHVVIAEHDMTIWFPKTMCREYYQSRNYLRNSVYLFSARSLENHEYIEGYRKESGKDLNEFIEYIKNDLVVNEFKFKDIYEETLNGFNFTVIKSIKASDKKVGRLSYIYKGINSYFVIYASYLIEEEESFKKKLNNSICKYEEDDDKSRIVRV